MALPVKNITKITYIPKDSIEHIVSASSVGNDRNPSAIDLMGASSLTSGYLVVRTPDYRFHVLLMIRRGHLLFRNNSSIPEERKFSEGTMIFLPAGTWYLYGADAPLELVWFHLCPQAPEWNFLKDVKFFTASAMDLECLRTMVLLLYRESNIPDKDDSGITWYSLRVIELLLHRILGRFVPESEAAGRLRALFDVVELSLEKPWTAAEMARHAGISISALFAVSRKYFGTPPMTRLHELRMNAAANLLKHTNYKLDAIASMVGLGCGFSLSRAFRKSHGVSPRDFRYRNRKTP